MFSHNSIYNCDTNVTARVQSKNSEDNNSTLSYIIGHSVVWKSVLNIPLRYVFLQNPAVSKVHNFNFIAFFKTSLLIPVYNLGHMKTLKTRFTRQTTVTAKHRKCSHNYIYTWMISAVSLRPACAGDLKYLILESNVSVVHTTVIDCKNQSITGPHV